jgi:shikimate dehydrogenase
MATFQSTDLLSVSHPPSILSGGYSLGLIGWPLAHSLSPRLHTAALRAAGLEGEYRLYPIAPGAAQEKELADLLEQVRKKELHGLNVTIPHKQAVIPLLDELTPVARAVGAVNTIYPRDRGLIGENTDVFGFLADVNRFIVAALSALPVTESVTPKRTALVLGAGGAARAVVYALLLSGWNVFIAARRLEQAKEVGERFAMSREQLSGDYERPSAICHSPSAIGDIAPTCQLIVNCTPLGMSPNITASPWPEAVPFPSHAMVYDLVYHPVETAFVRSARQAGLQAANGLGMLIEQAALSFECWTGRVADREAMRKAGS